MRRRHPLKAWLTAAALMLVACGGFVYGLLVARYRLPPFAAIERLHERYLKSDERKEQERKLAEELYWTIPPEYTLNDVPALISIRTPADVADRRARLVEFIWAGRGYPRDKLPARVERGITDARFAGMRNLAAIDRLVVEMDYGINSVVYHFHPAAATNRLILFHAGHEQSFTDSALSLSFFVARGYAVLAFDMPLQGMNNRPVLEVANLGKVTLRSHNYLSYLDAPFHFFVEPVAVALNYTGRHFRYELTGMTGLSGGGWTTLMCAALDERIARSYPVAGTMPEYARSYLDWGDYEQFAPALYRVANSLDLYVLAAHGENRRQLQIFNQFDPCCFQGLKYRTYEPHVRARVAALGRGGFSVLLDSTHRQHKVSDFALGEIARDMEH